MPALSMYSCPERVRLLTNGRHDERACTCDDFQNPSQCSGATSQAKGLVTMVYKTGGHQLHPCVRVASNPSPCTAIIEYIYATPDSERWWFWWSLEPIEPITEVDATGDKIVSAIGFPR